MSVLTIRLPSDYHQRLKDIAASKGISVNKLIEHLSISAIAEFDAFAKFKARAIGADREKAIQILERLNWEDGKNL
jgi:predicted DNA-binding ribbon-helix-helix protein